jgi:iron complex outermembrane receptor protein
VAGICSCLRVSTPEEFQQAIDRERPIGADAYSPEAGIDRPKQEIWHHLAVAHARADLGRVGELHARYAYQLDDRSEYAIVRESITGPQLQFGLATHDAALELEHARANLGHGWGLVGTVGGGFTQQANDFEAATTLIPDYVQWRGGAFVVERFVGERLEVELGGRYEGVDRVATLEERDYLSQLASGRLDEEACTADGSGGARCRHVFHAPSGAVGLLARPFERLSELAMRLTLDSSARIPAIDEQFMNGSAPSFPILGVGDSHLGVERTWGATTGLVYAGDWLRAEGDAYVSWVDDYIYFRPSPQEGQCAPLTCTSRGPLPVFAFEATDALFGGGEARLDLVAPRLPFAVSANGAWVRGYDVARDIDLSFVPANRYELTGRYLWPDTRVSSNGYLELSGTVVDHQRHYDPDADFASPPDAYVLLGAGAGVEFPTPTTLMRLSLRGTNLLNQRYREYTSLLRYFADEPGWGVQLRFSVEFSAGLDG